ncbi:hypothetical protein HAX54_025115, partial [Datura stramonium]|nr:hypothetical protein [Datura stramonium]
FRGASSPYHGLVVEPHLNLDAQILSLSVAQRLSRSLIFVSRTCRAPSLESGCAAKSSQRFMEVNVEHRIRDMVPSHTFTGICLKFHSRQNASAMDLSALDAAMVALSTTRGPIGDLFKGLAGEEEP